MQSQGNIGIHDKSERCTACGERVGWIGLWGNLALAVLKIVVGFISQSRALIADAFYSIKDVTTASAIIVGLKASQKPQDDKHPYGYGKIEFLSTAFIGLTIIIGSVVILIISLRGFLAGTTRPPLLIAAGAALASMIIKELMYRNAVCAGKHLNSPTIMAHAHHSRADVISSGAVFLGVLGENLGIRYLDSLVAIIEIIHMAAVSVEILQDGLKGLMDVSIESEKLDEIRDTVSVLPGVEKITQIRAHRVGQKIWIHLEIQVHPDRSIADGYNIAEQVRHSLMKRIRHIGDVMVRLAPQDGEDIGAIPQEAL
ncbi:cation diffusion facilitator family transporter [Candidatus Poribacteria bacterium]